MEDKLENISVRRMIWNMGYDTSQSLGVALVAGGILFILQDDHIAAISILAALNGLVLIVIGHLFKVIGKR